MVVSTRAVIMLHSEIITGKFHAFQQIEAEVAATRFLFGL